ncbi:MAG: hypothetical protein RLZ51_1899 [Pseudomonadota bacterium]|jgi:hypothetical protein
MDYRNARTLIDGRIDCEIEHPILGWIPFTADPADAGAQFDVAALHAQMLADPATAPYAPPSAEEVAAALDAARAAMSLSFAQLLIGLVSEAWMTEAEGEAWLAGALPAPITALIDTLPSEQRFAAKARALRPSVVERTDPLVLTLGAAQGKTPEQLDAFFTTYSQV